MSIKSSAPIQPFTDAFFQTVFQTSPDAALVTTFADGTILQVNAGFCRITGFSAEEAIGKTTLELNLYINSQDRKRFLDLMQHQGKLDGELVEFMRKDGSVFRGLLSSGMFSSNGIKYIITHVRDISEQLRMEQEKGESEENYRRLFETMSQGVVYQDAEGKIISANPAAERILGLGFQQMSQRTSMTPEWYTIREDGSPLPGSEHPSMIALRTGAPFGPYTLGVFNEQLNDHVWLSLTATPLFRAGEKKPYQVYAIMEDITTVRKAQQNYQLLFHEMVDGFALHEIICDESGKPVNYRYLAVNPAFERMTGLHASELIGTTVLDSMPGTEQYWIDIYGNVALTGNPVTFQNYSASLDKYFSVTAYRPAPMQFACTFSDITKQTRYQQEMERAQEQIAHLAHICDVAPSSIIVHDDEGQILYANEYACRMHGYQKAAFLSKRLSDLSPPVPSEVVAEGARKAREDGGFIRETTIKAADGRVIPLVIYARPIEWDGKPAILSIGTDLTEQQRTEHSLQTSIEQNRRILENLQDGFYQAYLSGKFIMLNPRMAQICGYDSVEELQILSTQVLYSNLDDRATLFDQLKTDGRVTDYVCQLLKKDKTPFWTSMHIQYLKNDAGEVIGTEGLIRDISAQKQLEEEIQKQHNSLIETNEVLKKRLEQSINAISKMGELRDVYTAGHQRRVQQLACQIGARCGMTQEAITSLSYGALIHDIGKIYIASDILNKPGKITNLEYQILQTHAEYSYNIVREMDLPQEILTMVLQHHERLDGSGYPNHLVGDQINLEGRILAVADVVEAMTSHRPYRPALGIDAALTEIETHKGRKYDSDVVNICISLFREQGFLFSVELEQA